MKLELTKEQIFNLITFISQEITSFDYVDPKKQMALEWRKNQEKIRKYLKTLLPETYNK